MSVSLSVDGSGDAELISAVRGGDSDAYGELFARHVDAARRLARQLAGPADADDLVSDAFTKVLTVLQRGGGPDLAFRAYLLTAVRRLHVDRIRAGSRLRPVDDLTPFDPGLPFQDTAVEGFDNAAAARAFASLPERWQMVLWHTEVEQQKPADIAPLLGMSANSVSALAYRAREGLRQAFLSQHATDPDDVDCAWTRDHLGAYVRGGLSRRDAARVDDHLSACRACAAVYLELTEVNSGLAALLAPLLLGSAGASYLSSTGAGSGVLSTSLTAAKTWVAAHASLTAVGGMVVAATAVLSIYGASQLGGGHNAADIGSPPVNRPPLSSVEPSNGNPDGQNGHDKTHGPGQSETPGRSASTTPSTPTQSTESTPPASQDSSAPPVEPNGPSTDASDPTTSPTDPTTDPTGPGSDQVSFSSTPPVDPKFGDTYDVSASSGSGKQVSLRVEPTSNSLGPACEIDGSVVTFTHAGTCVVVGETTGSEAANNKAAGARAEQSIRVPRQDQQVTFNTDAPRSPGLGDEYTVDATSDADLPVKLSIDPTSNALGEACSLKGTTVTFDHAASCRITATTGNDDYRNSTAHQSIDVPKAAQIVTFNSDAPPEPAFGDTYSVNAVSDAGLPVKISIHAASNALGQACSLKGTTVTFDHAASCRITATAGNDDYVTATDVQTVDVPQAAQIIQMTPAAPSTAIVGESYGFTATGGASGNDVEVGTNNADVCTIADGKVSFVAPGNCVISANQPENGDYLAAPTVTQSVNVVSKPYNVDLGVFGSKTGPVGGQSGVAATVTGSLPDKATATLTATADGTENFRPVLDEDRCAREDANSKTTVWTCTISARDLADGETTIWFVVNTQHGRDVTFAIQPDKPYFDDNQRNNTPPAIHWND